MNTQRCNSSDRAGAANTWAAGLKDVDTTHPRFTGGI
jgi:hypothetical protein